MKQRFSTTLIIVALVFLMPLSLLAQSPAPVKNVIFMIADGTSFSTISLARWYQRLTDPTQERLHLDPYLSGSIFTYCSNAPVGDSAPTTSTYMTGIPSIKGFVATYPFSDGEDDIIPLDPSMEYRPLMTLMQATKILQGRRIGLVATSEFPHATPADCVASSYSRKKYDWIVPQMVHNNIDVVIAGGAVLLHQEEMEFLKSKGYDVYKDDLSSLTEYQGDKLWSLFGPMDIAYDLDAVGGKDPRLDEMTAAALRILDGSEEGFMLMVEGSKIDWAAHANDPVGMATDLLAFDRAVGVALEFAKRDGNTVVIVTSDHGNSGLSIGKRELTNYAGASKKEVFGPLTDIRLTSIGMEAKLQDLESENIAEYFKEMTSIEITPEEAEILNLLRSLKGLKGKEKKAVLERIKELGVTTQKATRNMGDFSSLSSYIANIYRERMGLGFTTGGHTGEDTFLATYAPTQEQRLLGYNTNIELHDYMRALLGLEQSMLELSKEYFAPHSEVFDGMTYEVSGEQVTEMILTVKHDGHTLVIRPFTTQVWLDDEVKELPLSTVYSDKTQQFYLSKSVLDLFD